MTGLNESSMWNPYVETMSRKKLRNLQSQRLMDQFHHHFANSEYYSNVYTNHGITKQDIKSIEEFQTHVPVTRKSEIREKLVNSPRTLGGLVTDQNLITQYFSSTGTTGQPTFYACDQEGFDAVKECLCRIFASMGADSDDLIQIVSAGHHLISTAAIEAARTVGNNTLGVQAHVDEVDRFVHHLRRLIPDYSYNTQLIWELAKEKLEEEGITPDQVPINNVITSGEVQVPGRTEWIEQEWNTSNYDIYGLGEIPHPWVMSWCTNGIDGQERGYHIHEDYTFVEIIDPETEEPLPEGKRGEITITNLVDDAVAGIRWGTEDIGYIQSGKCDCGRTHRRVKVLGRDKYEIIVEGRSVFPSEVEDILWSTNGLDSPPTFRVLKEGDTMDTLKIKIVAGNDELRERAQENIESMLNVTAIVSELSQNEIDTDSYKQPVILEN